MSRRPRAKLPSPIRRFNSLPEVTRLAAMMDVRSPFSVGSVEDLLAERAIDHDTVRVWLDGFGSPFAADIRRQRVSARPAGHP